MIWTQLIKELRSVGYTQAEIASYCDCSQSFISDLYSGKIKNPSYPTGQTLLALQKKAKRRLARLEIKDSPAISQLQEANN